MSLEYEETDTIDHDHPHSEDRYKRLIEDWKSRCIKKVVSRKEWRKGGRTLRRAIDRKEIRFSETEIEEEDQLVNKCKAGNRTVSKLIITFENFEREEAQV